MGHTKSTKEQMVIEKRRGPRTEPRSTPKCRCQEDEEDLAEEPPQGTTVLII